MNKYIFFYLSVSISFFAACGDDSSNSSGTSCTVQENDDNSYTLSCPDGTSAVIKNGVNGKDGVDGVDGSGSLAAITISNEKPQGYASPLTVEISDLDLIAKEDSIQVHVSSNSDSDGLNLWAHKLGVSFVADLYFCVSKEDSKLLVKNGDKVTISYKDINPETTVTKEITWSNYTASSTGTLMFDKKIYIGDGATMTLVLTDADLMNETSISVAFCVQTSICPTIKLSGAGGVFSSQIKLSTKENNPSSNVYKVQNGDHISAIYSDNSPEQNVSADADFFTARQGYVQFGEDVWTFMENIDVYVYDEDNLDSVVELTLTSDIDKNGVKLHIPKVNGLYHGYAKVSFEKSPTDTVLHAKDGGQIFVTYYDSSTGVSQSDNSRLSPMNTFYVSYGDSVYYGYKDKAVVKVTDYRLGASPAVVHVWSSSDAGRAIELFFYGGTVSYTQLGFVEFTDKTPYEGQLKVSNGDKIYVEYTNIKDSTVRDSAMWKL